jgi:hypothetical protein
MFTRLHPLISALDTAARESQSDWAAHATDCNPGRFADRFAEIADAAEQLAASARRGEAAMRSAAERHEAGGGGVDVVVNGEERSDGECGGRSSTTRNYPARRQRRKRKAGGDWGWRPRRKIIQIFFTQAIDTFRYRW